MIFGRNIQKTTELSLQTYMKTETCKLYSGVFWIFSSNIIQIDCYNYELYSFKVGVFFWYTVYKYIPLLIAAVKKEVKYEEFRIVFEDDGSSVSEEVLAAILEDGERVGTLMVLQPSETWTKGVHSWLI